MTPFKTCPKICLPLWKFTGVLYHVGVDLVRKKGKKKSTPGTLYTKPPLMTHYNYSFI